MPGTRTLGPIVTTTQVEQAVATTLAQWIEYYLSEVERQHGLVAGFTQRPLGFGISYDLENRPQVQTPAILIFSPGTSAMEQSENATYGAWFDLHVGALVDDQTEPLVRGAASIYQAAIAACLVQQGGLGGFASSTILNGYEQRLPDITNRTQALGVVHAEVFVDNIIIGTQGPGRYDVPPAPNTGPWLAWPTVATHSQPITAVTKLP